MPTTLMDLLRRGDLDGTIAHLREAPDAARRAGTQIRALRAALLDAPGDGRSDAWEGEAWQVSDAVDLAFLASLPPEKAAAQGSISYEAAAALPQVIPDALPAFVEVWSQIFQRSPKNWDRTGHYGAMFQWVVDGHVPAPTQDGAVNLWIPRATQLVRPDAAPGPGEPTRPPHPTPETCPALYAVTLPRLFEAEVRPGLGAAAYDHTSGDAVIELIRHLVDTDVWQLAETRERLEASRRSPGRTATFQQRWLSRLDAALPSASARGRRPRY
ncbi:hypothetical protein [Ornithinimicrobium sp. Y1694]|uniref:hypothetical protein n=1 Tax=Ornithinimicrobium sp. Y1694 TaxID=3418590 RepID=UPI003CF3C55A